MIKHITKMNQNASRATITTIGLDLAKNLFRMPAEKIWAQTDPVCWLKAL